MDFKQAIRSFYKRAFDFKTRSSPSEFWWYMLFQFIVFFSVIFIAVMLVGGSGAFDSEEPPAWFTALLIPLGLFALVNIIPALAVVVRRFHDRNMSGWWYLLFIVGMIIPILGFLVVIALYVFMSLPGYPEPNKWGPNPLTGLEDTFG